MAANLTGSPTTTGVIEQRYLIEALGGARNPIDYLTRFPDELYSKSPESHLVRLMSALLGQSGVGQLHDNYLRARLLFEEHGLEAVDLEAFYGNPFQFGRILDEIYDSDPSGALTQAEWDLIRSKDASYRSRAIDFFNGVRAGNSPQGMRLVARSGLGHDVQIIENYQYLFDVHSDSPLGLRYYGSTTSTEEMIILPRRESTRSEVQQITIDSTASGGGFQLGFRGAFTTNISWSDPSNTASAFAVQNALKALPTIGAGNVTVTGGPTLVNGTLVVVPYQVLFTQALGGRNVPTLAVVDALTPNGGVTIETVANGIDSSDEVVDISPADRHSLQVAVDRIKPVTAIPTVYRANGLRKRQNWNRAMASSESVEVLRFVTGQSGVNWPQDATSYHWIVRNVEVEGPRSINDRDRHYQGFHNVTNVIGSSQHVGRFSNAQTRVFPYLAALTDDTLVYRADRILADYAAPLNVSSSITVGAKSVPLIQGIYPTDYASLPGVADIRYKDEQFWASNEQASGSETVIIDLGAVQAVNFMAFEISRKPVDISIEYDTLDSDNVFLWQDITPDANIPFPDSVAYSSEDRNPWVYSEFHFSDAKGHQIFTRYIRVTFARRIVAGAFLNGSPYSVDVRNLRVGRNVST